MNLKSRYHYRVGHSDKLEYKGPRGVFEEDSVSIDIIYMFKKTLEECKSSDFKILLNNISSLNLRHVYICNFL